MVERYNTGETPEDLRAKYNPDGSDLRRFQCRMLDMLLYIHKVCDENKIDYRLQAGNVLGAVRHGGFIPWDDDVDIVVSLKDQKRLKKILLSNPHPQYVLQCEDTDPGFYDFWMVLRDTKSEYVQDKAKHKLRKYRGAQIDIFAFESGCIPILKRMSKWVSLKVDYKLAPHSKYIARFVHNIQKYILHPIFRTISFFLGNHNYYSHSYGVSFNYYIHKDILLPHKEIEFEGEVFMGPANPVEFCRIRYGNYMELPPVDKRDHHKASYKIWD